MEYSIRPMCQTDRTGVIQMMRGFYASPAVLSNGSEEIFRADFDACIGETPYLEGFVFEGEGNLLGYGMLAKSFSTEFGRPCIWIEDLFIKEAYRGLGIGRAFIAFTENRHPGALLRLEAEEENERAICLYRKCGFEVLPYLELKKEC